MTYTHRLTDGQTQIHTDIHRQTIGLHAASDDFTVLCPNQPLAVSGY